MRMSSCLWSSSLLCLLACDPAGPAEPETETPEPTPSLPPSTPTPDPSPAARADCSNGRLLTVGYVVDGDTLEVQTTSASAS